MRFGVGLGTLTADSVMSPLKMVPSLSAGIWPDTKTRPAALMAWDCVEGPRGTRGLLLEKIIVRGNREKRRGGMYIRAKSWTDIIVSEQVRACRDE